MEETGEEGQEGLSAVELKHGADAAEGDGYGRPGAGGRAAGLGEGLQESGYGMGRRGRPMMELTVSDPAGRIGFTRD